MELLLLLLGAHFIGDFYLQPLQWIQCRSQNHIKSKGLWLHVLVHTLLNMLVFLLLSYAILPAILAISAIAISHLLTDCWKSYRKANLAYFLIDQAIHLMVIAIVWTVLSGFSFNEITLFIANSFTAKNLIIGMAYLLVCRPASIIIMIALKKHTDSLASHDNSSAQTAADNNQDFGLNSAGAWIGYIERCLAISFIFIGQFSGIGFLVAAKTIFRFGDLTNSKDIKLTEYMMLGTLLSYAIALLVGWNAMALYHAL